MVRRVSPLQWATPIVDEQGRPTKEFLTKWNNQLAVNSSIPGLGTVAEVSTVLDVIAAVSGDLLVRGATLWGALAPAGDATKFLNGATPPAYALVKDSDLSVSDIATHNVTDLAHGFAPKSPNDATKFLNGAAAPGYAQVKDADLALTDVTSNDVTALAHGFAPKLPNDATKYLDGTGAYSTPAGGGGGGSLAHASIPSNFTTNDTGAFATLGQAIMVAEAIKVYDVIINMNVATAGDVYSCFIAIIGSSGGITSTVGTPAARFTSTATGLQSAKLSFASPITLSPGTMYYIGCVLTSGSGTSACRAVTSASGVSSYAGVPLDAGQMVAKFSTTTKRFWYAQNSDAPSSGTPSSSATSGQYAISFTWSY